MANIRQSSKTNTLARKLKKLFDDARRPDEIVEKKLPTARGVYGFWLPHSVGNEILVDVGAEHSAVRSSNVRVCEFP